MSPCNTREAKVNVVNLPNKYSTRATFLRAAHRAPWRQRYVISAWSRCTKDVAVGIYVNKPILVGLVQTPTLTRQTSLETFSCALAHMSQYLKIKSPRMINIIVFINNMQCFSLGDSILLCNILFCSCFGRTKHVEWYWNRLCGHRFSPVLKHIKWYWNCLCGHCFSPVLNITSDNETACVATALGLCLKYIRWYWYCLYCLCGQLL